jgi:hypothetical protein
MERERNIDYSVEEDLSIDERSESRLDSSDISGIDSFA